LFPVRLLGVGMSKIFDDVTGDDTESEGDDDLLDYDTDTDDDDDEDDLGTRPATTTS
jgi:hypothetical protein